MPMTAQDLASLRRDRSPARLPAARGPLTEFLFSAWRDAPHQIGRAPGYGDDLLDGEDAVLALYCLYELHYRGFGGVAEDWEWEPSLLALRARLEASFDLQLRRGVGPVVADGDIETALHALLDASAGPSLSDYMATDGTVELGFRTSRTAFGGIYGPGL
ncbi:MAG TPA: hypothetical protein VFD31_12060 [Thermoleophilaceae bacterium]|nr:hypothetical protein [Thermoleophilaceae bacterium]